MPYETRSYSFERRLSPEWLVVMFIRAATPLHVLVYVEGSKGEVLDVWCGEYKDIRELWSTTLDRVVFG